MTQKIDIGRVVAGVFEIYRAHAVVLLPVAAALFLIEAVISGLLVELAGILIILAIIVQQVITYLYQGTVVSLVNDVQDGRRDFSVGELMKSVTPVLLTLIVAGILASIAIFVGFVLLIVPGLFLLTILAVFVPVIVVERKGVFESFGRSRELVRGNGWQVLGVIVIFFLILLVVSVAFNIIGGAIGGVGRVILDFIGSVVAAPLIALAASVLYFNLRAAKHEAPSSGGQLDATGGAAATAPATAGRQEPAGTEPTSPRPSAPPPGAPQEPGGSP